MSYSRVNKWLSGFLPIASRSSRGDLHGSYSGGKNECDEGISLAILIATLAGIAVLAFTLYTKVTMAGRRRREGDASFGRYGAGDLLGVLYLGTRSKTYQQHIKKHMSHILLPDMMTIHALELLLGLSL